MFILANLNICFTYMVFNNGKLDMDNKKIQII